MSTVSLEWQVLLCLVLQTKHTKQVPVLHGQGGNFLAFPLSVNIWHFPTASLRLGYNFGLGPHLCLGMHISMSMPILCTNVGLGRH